jgi:peptide/nickel transport system permease protein
MIDPEVGGQIFAPGTGAVLELSPLADGAGQPRRATWYRQPALMAGLVITGIIIASAIFAPLLTSYNPIAQNLNATL